MKILNAKVKNIVEIAGSQKAINCPKSDASTWSSHPKVYLQFNKHGQCICPYCSTLYQLKA